MTSMRLAYVGNFRHPHCTEVHLAASLESLGHRVTHWQEDKVDWPRMAAWAVKARIDGLVWTRTWSTPMEPGLEGLGRLRLAGIPSVGFHLDRWWGLEREYQVETEPFFKVDVLLTADGGHEAEWAKAGIRHVWSPPGVYDAECGPVAPDSRRWPHEVVFVGSHPYPHPGWEPYRTAVIEACQARYGARFGVWPQGRAIRGRALQQLYATARVVVGDSCLVGGAERYWSDRVPETLGRGACLIHPRVEGMNDWYRSGHDLVTYPLGDIDLMLALTDALLADPGRAAQIAAKGRQTVLGRDTYRHRAETLLSEMRAVSGVLR